MQWFKFYGVEYLSDPKVRNFTPQQHACWIHILCFASSASTPGVIEHLTEKNLMIYAGIDPTSKEWNATKGILQLFEEMKMIHVDVTTHVVTVTHWDTRQEAYTTNAERQRRYREKKALQRPLQQSNARIEENRIEEKKDAEISKEISSLSEIREVRIDSEGKEKQPKQQKIMDTRALRLRNQMYDLLEKDNGVRPTPHMGDYARVSEALKALNETQALDMFQDAISRKTVHTVREVFTARNIDIFREEL